MRFKKEHKDSNQQSRASANRESSDSQKSSDAGEIERQAISNPRQEAQAQRIAQAVAENSSKSQDLAQYQSRLDSGPIGKGLQLKSRRAPGSDGASDSVEVAQPNSESPIQMAEPEPRNIVHSPYIDRHAAPGTASDDVARANAQIRETEHDKDPFKEAKEAAINQEQRRVAAMNKFQAWLDLDGKKKELEKELQQYATDSIPRKECEGKIAGIAEVMKLYA